MGVMGIGRGRREGLWLARGGAISTGAGGWVNRRGAAGRSKLRASPRRSRGTRQAHPATGYTGELVLWDTLAGKRGLRVLCRHEPKRHGTWPGLRGPAAEDLKEPPRSSRGPARMNMAWGDAPGWGGVYW